MNIRSYSLFKTTLSLCSLHFFHRTTPTTLHTTARLDRSFSLWSSRKTIRESKPELSSEQRMKQSIRSYPLLYFQSTWNLKTTSRFVSLPLFHIHTFPPSLANSLTHHHVLTITVCYSLDFTVHYKTARRRDYCRKGCWYNLTQEHSIASEIWWAHCWSDSQIWPNLSEARAGTYHVCMWEGSFFV